MPRRSPRASHATIPAASAHRLRLLDHPVALPVAAALAAARSHPSSALSLSAIPPPEPAPALLPHLRVHPLASAQAIGGNALQRLPLPPAQTSSRARRTPCRHRKAP